MRNYAFRLPLSVAEGVTPRGSLRSVPTVGVPRLRVVRLYH